MSFLPYILNLILLFTSNSQSLISLPKAINSVEKGFFSIIGKGENYIQIAAHEKFIKIYNDGKITTTSSIVKYYLSTIFINNYRIYFPSNNYVYIIINQTISSKKFSDHQNEYISSLVERKNTLTIITLYQGIIEVAYINEDREITTFVSENTLEEEYNKISFFYCEKIIYNIRMPCIYLYDETPKIFDLYQNTTSFKVYLFSQPKEIGLNPSYSIKFIDISSSITSNSNFRFVCSVQKSDNSIQCIKIIRNENGNNSYNNYISLTDEYYSFLKSCTNDIRDFNIEKFDNEFLACCSQSSKIYCNRLDLSYNFINEFYILLNEDSEAHSTKISYFDSKLAFIIFGTYKENKIFVYSLFFPQCIDIDNLYVINELIINENIDNLFDAINKKTNNILSFKFIDLPNNSQLEMYYSNTGTTFNLINDNTQLYEITENSLLKFKNTLSSPNVVLSTINYYIYSNETYQSKMCSIKINSLKCNIGCLNCNKIPSECTECDNNDNYYYSPEINTECYNLNEKKEEWFFDKIEKKFYICSKSCKHYITLSNENLIDCGNNYIYYPVENKNECWLKETNNNYYFFNTNTKQFEECYERCNSCTKKRDILTQNCISCKSDYILLNNNCYLPTEKVENYYYNLTQNKFIECYSSCKYCNGLGEINNNNCKVCKNSLYLYHNNCYLTCPKGTYSYSKNEINSCKKNISEEENSEIKKDMNLNEIIDLIDNNLEDYINPNNIIDGEHFDIIIYDVEDEYEANLNNEKNKLSIIELNECIDILRKEYKLSEEERIIMIKIDQNITNSPVNKVEFFLYTQNGIELDTSYCKDMNINIKKPLININFDIDSANYLDNLGINAFDPTDDFFNDICFSFTNENGTDVILLDRKNDYFQNQTFCEDNCPNFKIDYNDLYVNCECIPESSDKKYDDLLNENTNVNFGNIKKAFTSNLYKTNIIIAKCYQYVFKWKKMNKNLGNWIMMGLIVIELIFFFIFLKKRLRPIKNYLYLQYYEKGIDKQKNKNNIDLKETEDLNIRNSLSNGTSNPPRRKSTFNHQKQKSSLENLKDKVIFDINSSDESSNRNSNIISNDYSNSSNQNNNSKRVNTKKNSIIDNHSILNNFDDIYSIKNISNKNSFHIRKSTSKLPTKIRNSFIEILPTSLSKNPFEKLNKNELRDSISIYKNPRNSKINRRSTFLKELNNINKKIIKTDSNNKLINTLEIKENEEEIKKKPSNNYLTSNDYFDLEFEEALKLDKRSFLQLIWGYILEEQIIFNTFISEIFLELRVIKIYFMIFSFSLELFLNAIFFSDDYISEMYHNDGVLDFFSSLPKSIYSLLIGLLIMFFLNFLSNSKDAFKEATNKIYDKEEYKKKVKKILCGLRIKLSFFFTLNFIFMFFFWYYCSTFCAIYSNSQNELIKGTLISIFTSLLIPFPVSIIMALIRYIALKKKNKCLFKINNIIDKVI